MSELFDRLQATALARVMLDSSWAWPLAEILHFAGMTLLFGSVLVMDLRLFGVLGRLPASVMRELARVAGAGFAVNLVTGAAFFIAEPGLYGGNPAFRWKLLAVVLAGANLLAYRLLLHPAIERGTDPARSPAAWLIGAASLLLWTGVVVLGRFIPAFSAT